MNLYKEATDKRWGAIVAASKDDLRKALREQPGLIAEIKVEALEEFNAACCAADEYLDVMFDEYLACLRKQSGRPGADHDESAEQAES